MKLRILRWGDYPGLCGWVLNTITHSLLRGKQKEILCTCRRPEGRVERDLEMLALKTGVMWPQAKEGRQPPEAGRSQKWVFP